MKTKATIGVGIALTMLTLAALMPSLGFADATLSDTDNYLGTIVVGNSAPTITNVAVSTSPYWDVWTYYNVSVEVQDNNTLTDISWVRITLYDNSSSYGAVGSNRSHYTFTYTASDNSWHENAPDAGGSHINTGASVDANPSLTWDNYRFNVRLAKTANPIAWDITAEVMNHTTFDNRTYIGIFNVNKYIEISHIENSVFWYGLSAGDIDKPCDTFPATTTVISNDTWKEQTALENATWISGVNSIPDNYTKYWSTDTVGSAVPFTTSYADVQTGQSYTAETGTVDNLYMWASIPAPKAQGSYTNTILVKVSITT